MQAVKRSQYRKEMAVVLGLSILLLIPRSIIGGNPQASSGSQTEKGATPEAGITSTYALGDVTAMDPSGKILSLQTSSGDVTVRFDDQTKVLRLAPGEKSLEKGEVIHPAEVAIGDRLLARGKVADDRKSVSARQLIVMSKAAIAQKQEREREEWRRRSVAGAVTAVNSVTREITLTIRSREGSQQIVVAAPDSARFRRYAPDSVKFADARPGSLSELRVGDLVRALGERSADGSHLLAEEIVSGAFVMVGGPILSVNATAGEIKISDIPTQKPLTVVVSKDSVLRRIPPRLAMMLQQRSERGPQPPGGAWPRQDNARPRVRPDGPANAGVERGRNGGGDLQEMLERLPPAGIADLKPGDVILASSSKGAAPGRVTAILLAAGVEALLARPQAGPAGEGASEASLGLPSGVLDFEIGLPQD